MQRLCWVALIATTGCNSLWASFQVPNPENCVLNPGLCTNTYMCNPQTQRCEEKIFQLQPAADNSEPDDGGLLTDDGGFSKFDAACGTVQVQATLIKSPADIIMIIDNSGSMTSEITAVQENINNSLAKVLANAGLDYRVILISKHGSASADQSICISMPLAGNASCNPAPVKPTFATHFFHYSVEIASTNSLNLILSTYAQADSLGLAPTGWQAWLRPNAAKTFIEVTDDNHSSAYTATTFDTALLALSPTQFGTPAQRNYLFHSMIGVQENTIATEPYPATAAFVTTKCASAVNTGSVYQNLSILTGGLRFPVCETANYDSMFQAVAQELVKGTKLVCNFGVPSPPPGKQYVLTAAQLKYTPSDGSAASYFNQVSDLGQCGARTFYVSGGRIYLCPATCNAVEADNKAKFEVLLDCNSVIG